MILKSQNLLYGCPEEKIDFESKILWTWSKELISTLDNQKKADDIKHTEELHKKGWADEIGPWTLHAEDVRGQLIDFLKAHWFELIDSNKHEKYRNLELNLTVVVPHQHGYFSEKTFCKILREAGYSKKAYMEWKNRKGKGGNKKYG